MREYSPEGWLLRAYIETVRVWAPSKYKSGSPNPSGHEPTGPVTNPTMTSFRRFAFVALLPVLLASLSREALASNVAATRITPNPGAQDTTFMADGSYTLELAVGGQTVSMTFTVEKKPDGSFVGLFKHPEIGEFPTTSFRVDGRKLSMDIVTPGGPAAVTLTVNNESAVEGEWSMQGDGSKISGKKTR